MPAVKPRCLPLNKILFQIKIDPMADIQIIPQAEFHKVSAAPIVKYAQMAILADMSRFNALNAVKKAGSGHLGSSFSSLDIVTWLYQAEMNLKELGIHNPDRDIYFSSKGHDVPGQYAVLYSLGIIPREQLLLLRRLGGTCGHPDVSTPGIEANSGSLGMGISKAKGMALAKKLRGWQGRIFVMTGDGELQEGQIYEGLQTAVHQGITNLNVIVDHNKVQSDKLVQEITNLRELEDKFRSFGWYVSRCDGHDFRQLEEVFRDFRQITDRPKIVIADTIKGRGVSFMEHPAALAANQGIYRWHSGAPDDQAFALAREEIAQRLLDRCREAGLAPVQIEPVPQEEKSVSGVSRDYVADAYGQALLALARERQDFLVLDADLAADCRVRQFEAHFPDRFVENGIAEQDMVSMAGGLALQGWLPVVNTFGAFLSARANEQIYNNACENTRIVYVNHYSGLIPAGPGQSHQSIRDISLLGALPNFVIIQPCNPAETRLATEYCIKDAKDNCVLRLIIGPCPRTITLPENYQFTYGQGVALTQGNDAVIFAYGPVMLHEALVAAELLQARNFGLQVVNMPWLNRVDESWLRQTVGKSMPIYVLEDHAPVGGLGDYLLNVLVSTGLLKNRNFRKFGVEGYPAWGTPPEVLKFHHLAGEDLAHIILGH